MNHIGNILFVAEGSPGEQPAFRRALGLARERRSTLTILRASGVPFDPSDQVHENAEAKSANFHVEITEGQATPEDVARFAKRGQFDLIIKAACNRGVVITSLFSDPDAELIRIAPCPVWIIRPASSTRGGPARVLAAVNPVYANSGGGGLAPQVLEVAASLARHTNGELHVVNAWRVAAEGMLRGRPIHVSDIHRLLRTIRAAHEKQLDRLLKQQDVAGTTVHIHKGRADAVIRGLLRRWHFDDIVIGSKPGSGPLSLFRSGIAEKVLRSADCSVFAVKQA